MTRLPLPAEPCPSTLLQQHMADLLRRGSDVAPGFLNSVLNQLNWAFSEFIGMIQEVGCGGPRCVGKGWAETKAHQCGKASGCSLLPVGGLDSTGRRAPGAELCGQPAAQGLCHLL